MSGVPDRRSLLKASAVAGGLVWVRPTMRTIEGFGAAGSAPPQTTTPTTVGPPDSIVFAGVLNSAQGGLNSAPDCPGFVLDVIGFADLSGLGPTNVVLSPCFDYPADPQNTYHSTGGHFVLTPAAGTIVGTISGTLSQQGPFAPPLRIDWALEITGGTGAYTGVTGTATHVGDLTDISTSVGTLSGTIELPGV